MCRTSQRYAQKQLVTRHPRHGTFNIDVVGFFRLTYRVFEELSYIPKDLLEDEGKSMVIRKIMEQHKEELKVFASSMKKQGNLFLQRSISMTCPWKI